MKPKDIALAVLVAFAWGFNFVAIRWGLDAFPPLFFSALRFMCAAFPAIFLVGRGNVPWKYILEVGLFLGFLMFALLFVGMQIGMPPGLSSLVIQSQTVFTSIMAAIFLKDRPTLIQGLGIGVAIGGIVLVGFNAGGQTSLTGLILVLLAANCWAVSNIIMKVAGNVDMFRLIIWMTPLPILPLLVLSGIFESNQIAALINIDWSEVFAIGFTGLVCTTWALSVWGRLLKTYPTNVVVPFALLVPIFGILSAIVVFGESFGVLKIVASAVVFLGVATNVLGQGFVNRRNHRI